MATDIPGQIGPYRVREQIGRESGSALFRAADPSGRPVTVQLLPSRLTEDAAAYERFRTEAAALSRNGHPNVVHVLGTGQEGDRPYLVLEAFEGTPLSDVLRDRRLSIAEAFAVMKALCRGLAHCHEHGVLHRHLWPHAVRVSPDLSQVKLTELGFSRLDALGMTGTLNTGALSLGAMHYLAPEQMSSQPVDHRADLYSAGVIFQEMLTGRPPGGRIALPSQVNSELPPETDVIVLKCLARNPLERYATAIDLLDGIERLEEHMRVRLLSELRGITRPGSRSKLVFAGIAVLVVIMVILGIVLL